MPMKSIGWYSQIRCCLLEASVQALEQYDIPVPDYRSIKDYGIKGDPGCCSALIVNANQTVRPTLGGACPGPTPKRLFYTVKLYRPVCQDPDRGCVDNGPLDPCSELLGCEPGGFYTQDPGCDIYWTQYGLDADRLALESLVPRLFKQCRCDGCEPGCLEDCDSVWWQQTVPISGGGCGGVQVQFGIETV